MDVCISKWIICKDVNLDIIVFLSANDIQLSGVINNKYPFGFNWVNAFSRKSFIKLWFFAALFPFSKIFA